MVPGRGKVGGTLGGVTGDCEEERKGGRKVITSSAGNFPTKRDTHEFVKKVKMVIPNRRRKRLYLVSQAKGLAFMTASECQKLFEREEQKREEGRSMASHYP